MIPPIAHRIWLGARPRPTRYDDYWKTFQEFHPEWQLLTWTDDNLPYIENRDVFEEVRGRARSAGIPMDPERAVAVQQADILAYELVFQFGGVVLNCDMQPLRSLEPLAVESAFLGMEDDWHVCNAVMAGSSEHPLFGAVIAALPSRVAQHRGEGMEVETGPRLLTEVWRSQLWDVTVLPRESFYYAHHGALGEALDASHLEDAARSYGAYMLHHWGHRAQESY
jgi:inositol phosphorylceramide mannosyltransferase catalytic subunit